MMDEQLRDNVERLLRHRREEPSPEFLARLEARLREPARRPRGAPILVTHADRPGAAALTPQDEALFDDPVLAENAWRHLGTLLAGGAAFEATGKAPEGLHTNPFYAVDRVLHGEVGAKKVTIRRTLPSLPPKWMMRDFPTAGARYVVLLLPDDAPKAKSGDLFGAAAVAAAIPIPHTPANVKAVERLAALAKSKEARKELEAVLAALETARLEESAVERGEMLDAVARRGRAVLPYLHAVALSAAPSRGLARELVDRILWGGHADLRRELVAFATTNGYGMLRAINTRTSSGRRALELADAALREAPRAAIALLIELLDDERVLEGGVWVCQNALCLLIEITDRAVTPFHTMGQEDAARHNAELRREWRAWWASMRGKPEADWFFGLAPAEKSRLKMMWLPAPGEVETFPAPPPVLREEDLAFATKLGARAAPFLLASVCVDPPRATLWDAEHVEWNPTALKLLEAATGVSFGGFDPKDPRRDGANRAVLRKWQDWAARR
jgi:hypothetical protein